MVGETAVPVSTGLASIDALMGGLTPGDNVVWIGDDESLHALIERAFLEAGSGPRILVTMTDEPVPPVPGVEVLDARPGADLADPVALERAITERGSAWDARFVLRDLDTLVARMGPMKTLGFFTRTCPRLFDLGGLAYWRASRNGSGAILDSVQRVTQCVIDHTGGRLRFRKAESRPGVSGGIFDLVRTGDTLEFEEVRALGRLAEGLRRLRIERGLTQTEIARLAGVSPSAISQTESGHRGLAVDTLLTLAESVGISLDDLLDRRVDDGYVLARRDRIPARRGIVPLLDDPSSGLRAYLIKLGPGEAGGPSTIHKGAELIMVGAGLVQIDLTVEAPVMRAGDALLVTKDAINGWRNLHAEPARLFWIVRD